MELSENATEQNGSLLCSLAAAPPSCRWDVLFFVSVLRNMLPIRALHQLLSHVPGNHWLPCPPLWGRRKRKLLFTFFSLFFADSPFSFAARRLSSFFLVQLLCNIHPCWVVVILHGHWSRKIDPKFDNFLRSPLFNYFSLRLTVRVQYYCQSVFGKFPMPFFRSPQKE